jgi:hypothetical protein
MTLTVATVQVTTDGRGNARVVDKVMRTIDEGDGGGDPIPHRVPPVDRAGLVRPVTTGA